MIDKEASIAQLKETLENLAADPPVQLEYVRHLGVDVDELALEFDDFAVVRDTLLDEGALTQEQHDAIASVDQQLLNMTHAGPSRWTDEALTSGEDWQEVRRLARRALASLDSHQ